MNHLSRTKRSDCGQRAWNISARCILICLSASLLVSCARSQRITDVGALWIDPDVSAIYSLWPYEEVPILSRPDPRPGFDCNENGIDDAFDIFGIVPRGPYLVGNRPDHITAADLDGDNDKELLISNYVDGTLTILWQRSFRRFDRRSDIDLKSGWEVAPLAIGQPTCIAAGDLDADSRVDIVVGFLEPKTIIAVLRNQGDVDGDGEVDFEREEIADAEAEPFAARCVAIADMNGDGDFDIIAARPRGGPGISGLNLAQVVLYQNAGDGTFDERAYKPLDGDVVEFPFTDRLPIALADLGGTGHPVIIGLSLGNHPIYVIENGTSDATSFEDWYVRTVFMLPPGTPVGLVSAELDANPGPDLAMLKKLTEHGVTTGMVNVLPNVDGQLVSHTSEGTSLFDYTLGAAVGLGINAGDVDNDGLIDLVAAAGPENSITVLRNFFARKFRPAVSLPVSTEPADIYVGNLDWDTRPEIAVSHRGTTDVWVLHVRPEPVSQDCNINNRPDSCDTRDNPGFDADHDGVLDSCGGPLPPRVLSTPRWLP